MNRGDGGGVCGFCLCVAVCIWVYMCVAFVCISIHVCVCVWASRLWQWCVQSGGCSIAIYSVCVCVCVLGGVHYTSKVEGNLTL